MNYNLNQVLDMESKFINKREEVHILVNGFVCWYCSKFTKVPN